MPENAADGFVDDSSFFDETYVSMNELLLPEGAARGDIVELLQLIQVPPGSVILDCPCGYGRHMPHVREYGHKVVGIDRALAQLRSAQQLYGPGPCWLGDYRCLPCRDSCVDLALALSTPLGYSTYGDDELAMQEFYRVLKPGALMVIETVHRDAVSGRSSRDWRRLPDGSFLAIEREFDYIRGRTTAKYHRVHLNGQITVRQRKNLLYTVSEWHRLVEDAGFSVAGCFGDLRGGSFRSEGRLVLLLRR